MGPYAELDLTPQEEAELTWIDKLASQRARALALRAATERCHPRRTSHRLRLCLYPPRLLDPNPRDVR